MLGDRSASNYYYTRESDLSPSQCAANEMHFVAAPDRFLTRKLRAVCARRDLDPELRCNRSISPNVTLSIDIVATIRCDRSSIDFRKRFRFGFFFIAIVWRVNTSVCAFLLPALSLFLSPMHFKFHHFADICSAGYCNEMHCVSRCPDA